MVDLSLLVGAGVVGLLVGSFLNVCIHRLPNDQSVVTPPSHCPACRTPLRWYHNIPVLSWLALGGRCAFCRTSISWRYPLVELLTATLFVVHAWWFGPTPLLAVRLVFAAALVVLFLTDLDCRILPNEITLGGIVFGWIAAAVLPPGLVSSLIGTVAGGGVLWGTGALYERVRGVEGMGMGDVKMLAMVGAVLGWPLMIVTLVFASFTGGLFGMALIAMRADARTTAVPFGTFLAVGALVASLFGDGLLTWYLGLYAL
jgi:leader peptidase (prepilin peptidase)/N-methyltransferase